MLPFSIGNHTQNTSAFFIENGSMNSQSQIDMIVFLENVRYETKFTLLSDTDIVYRYLLLVYLPFFCCTACVYKFHFVMMGG